MAVLKAKSLYDCDKVRLISFRLGKQTQPIEMFLVLENGMKGVLSYFESESLRVYCRSKEYRTYYISKRSTLLTKRNSKEILQNIRLLIKIYTHSTDKRSSG